MNWEAIGAIAELLGAIGVIASLVYLARQIRDGQRAIRAGSYQQFRQDIHHAINSALNIPGLDEIVSSGMASYDELGHADAFRFNMWVTGVMHSYDNAYYQYRMGMLDDERWQMHRADIATFFEMPGIIEWWNHHTVPATGIRRGGGTRFSPSFVALVSEILAESDRAVPEAPSSESEVQA